MKKYSWKIDFFQTDANKVGKELEKIEQNGDLNTEAIVEYARNPKTTLNKMFEWDNTIAGEKYRIIQASRIITNIQVDYIGKDEDGDEKPKQVRAFVKTTKKTKESYQNIEAVVSDAGKYAMLLEKAYKELNGTKNRYKELEEIQELLKDIPEIY
jgi:hypothetical protein